MPIDEKLNLPPREKNHVAVIADAAEAKVKTIEKLAHKKTQALMRTIDRLNKENLDLKRQSQDHRRSATFKKLETELGKQDAIIMCLKDELQIIHGDAYVHKCVTEVLTRGPPRVQTKTRQELIHENKKLRMEVKALNIKETTVAPPKEEKPREDEEDERDYILNTQKEKIDALQQENTSLQVELECQNKRLEQQEKQLLLSVTQTRTTKFDRERAQFENKIHLLDNENKRLKETNENLKRRAESDAKSISALEKEKLNEMQRMQEVEDKHQENLENQSIDLNKKVLDVIKKQRDEKARNEELTAQIKTLTARAEVAKQDLAVAHEKNTQHEILHEQAKKKLQEDIDAAQEEARNLRTTNASVEKAHEETLTKVQETDAQVEQLTSNISALKGAQDDNEAERASLVARLEGHKDCDDVRVERDALRERYNSAQLKIQELEERLTKQPADDDVPAAVDREVKMCISCRKTKLEVEQLQNKLAETIKDCQRRLKEQPRSERLEKLEDEKQALEEENDALQEKVKKLIEQKKMAQSCLRKSGMGDDN